MLVLLPLLAGWLGGPRAGDPELDERQRGQVTNAYAAAFRIVSTVLAFGLMTLSLINLFEVQLTAPPLKQWAAFLAPTILLIGSLPKAILAWTEPDFSDE